MLLAEDVLGKVLLSLRRDTCCLIPRPALCAAGPGHGGGPQAAGFLQPLWERTLSWSGILRKGDS